MATLVLLLVVGLAAGGLVFATRGSSRRPGRRGTAGAPTTQAPATPTTRAGRHPAGPGSGPCRTTWPSCASWSSGGGCR